MGLGIKREKIGDILVREDFAFVVVLKDIADYIRINLTKVGNARVEIDIVNPDELDILEPKVKEISSTVASLRLDSVASAGFGISRSKTADLIRGEKVAVIGRRPPILQGLSRRVIQFQSGEKAG